VITSLVMAGLVPAIHVFPFLKLFKTWMAGTSPGMTALLERGVVKRNHPTSPFIPFTGALSGNTDCASTLSSRPR
jgi:hypothetical protein